MRVCVCVLFLSQGQAAWMLYIDVFCLSADGGIFDASLAAVVAALASVRLPRVKLSEDGQVTLAGGETGEVPMEADGDIGGGRIVEGCSNLELASTPLALTCGMYKVRHVGGLHTAVEPLSSELATGEFNSPPNFSDFARRAGVLAGCCACEHKGLAVGCAAGTSVGRSERRGGQHDGGASDSGDGRKGPPGKSHTHLLASTVHGLYMDCTWTVHGPYIMMEVLVTVVMDDKGRLVRAIRTFSLRLYMDCTRTVHGLYMDCTS
eukprot:1184549-Prorocentrum_minimum.AAC.7